MRKSMIAGVAFAVGAALATPMVAFSAANEEPQLAQAGPGMHGPGMHGSGMHGPGMPGMGGMMGGMMGGRWKTMTAWGGWGTTMAGWAG